MKKNEKLEKVIIKSDHPLFAHIPPRDNTMFSQMSGHDLQDLIFYLNLYPLELRNRLGLDQAITFGFEIETELVDYKRLDDECEEDKFPGWRDEYDCSLQSGREIQSPILRDTQKSWEELKQMCTFLKDISCIDKCAGGHIHVGAQIFQGDLKALLNFLKCWAVYEHIIYRFCYGEFLNARPKLKKYAPPVAPQLLELYDKFKEQPDSLVEKLFWDIDRHSAINFGNTYNLKKTEEYNTIEFRCPNGSLEPVIWQNNLNLFARLLLYSKSARYDDRIIDQRREANGETIPLDFYSEIYLQQALEFCDLIFTKNVDKLYFLRQYLKSYQIADTYCRADTFIKKIKH